MKKNVINEAIFALKKGEIIVYPTDTLYGIGADIKNIEAVEKIYNSNNTRVNNLLKMQDEYTRAIYMSDCPGEIKDIISKAIKEIKSLKVA